MAIVTLTPQPISRSGLAAVYTAVSVIADTYSFVNDGRTALHFKKTGAGAATITLMTTALSDGLAVADLTVIVPGTTGDLFVGPFARATFNNASGQMSFQTSEGTGLTVAVLQAPV
jgi:hypothetical protein